MCAAGCWNLSFEMEVGGGQGSPSILPLRFPTPTLAAPPRMAVGPVPSTHRFTKHPDGRVSSKRTHRC